MRKELAKIAEVRKRFKGTFVRFGRKVGWKGRSEETILFRDVIELSTGVRVTDHLWFNLTKEFENVQLNEGDVIEFDARVKQYEKGYVNRSAGIDKSRIDFKLSHPTRVKKIS